MSKTLDVLRAKYQVNHNPIPHKDPNAIILYYNPPTSACNVGASNPQINDLLRAHILIKDKRNWDIQTSAYQ